MASNACRILKVEWTAFVVARSCTVRGKVREHTRDCHLVFVPNSETVPKRGAVPTKFLGVFSNLESYAGVWTRFRLSKAVNWLLQSVDRDEP